MELTKEEREVLEFMLETSDHRYVNKNLEAAFGNGCLSEFRKFIIEHNKKVEKSEKLNALMRGYDNKIIVYYHNHKLWELSLTGGMGRVSFNFNHARYTKDWRQIFDNLIDNEKFEYSKDRRDSKNIRLKSFPAMKVNKNENGDIIGGTIGDIHCDREAFSSEFVRESFRVIKDLIHDFFDTSEHTFDYFKELVEKEYKCTGRMVSGINPYVEKVWQQRLFFEYFDCFEQENRGNDLFVYDLEFKQPFPDKKKHVIPYAKEHGAQYLEVTAKQIKEKVTTNCPDMFALRIEEGKPPVFVMIEVKSTKKACIGDSDIKTHLKGMHDYSKQEIFMKSRFKDASEIMRQFKLFGFIPETVDVPELSAQTKVERVLLITNNYSSEEREEDGGALAYYEENKESIMQWAKDYECQIWLTDNLYTDAKIDIQIVPNKN